jgi:hypothetical protein
LRQTAEDLLAKIVTLQSNPHYRVADVYYRRGVRWADSTKHVLSRPEFEGTILRCYVELNGGTERQNIGLLWDVIEGATKRHDYPTPKPDELVIHVRAGDTIIQPWFLSQNLSEQIDRFDLPRCSLVIAFAFQEFAERNAWMFSQEKLDENLTRIRTEVEQLLFHHPGVQFDVVSSPNIDRDFAYMAAADHFVRDHGGFSELISDLHAYRRGIAVPVGEAVSNPQSL